MKKKKSSKKSNLDDSLAYRCPELAAEWHYEKNGDLTPYDVSAQSNKKVWWYLRYVNPKTGKQHNFVWEARICNRVNKSGCPFLSGKAVWRGFNDLLSVNPKLANEWHPSKNGNLTPEMVTATSDKKVWWYLPYDDPMTGNHYDFEWQATIYHRSKGTGCPFLNGKKVWIGFNDLESLCPELASQWNIEKNGLLKPSDVTAGSGRKVWWVLFYNDTKTGKIYKFEWLAGIDKRVRGEGCPYLCGKAVWPGFNDLATVNPELAKQWHITKNKGKTAAQVTAYSNKSVWWQYSYDDPKTGKHFDFEWQASPASRMAASGCPYLSGNKVWTGFNDLMTKNPSLAKEWNYKRNGKLRPENITTNSRKCVWWYLPYDDPMTGKHYDFEWQARVIDRNKGDGCPFLSGNRVQVGFNDLKTIRPDIAAQWNYRKNKKLTPEMVTVNSNRKVWWYCSECGREWYETVAHRVAGSKCKCTWRD